MKTEFNKVNVEIIDLNTADVITESPQSVDNDFNAPVIGINKNDQFNTLG